MALMTKTQERIDFDRFCPPTPNTSGVLVTGGAQRIGAAISDHLAALGWRVAIHHNKSEAPALALRDRIRQRGDRAEIIACDLSETGQTEELLQRASDLIGPVGVLINNASVFHWDDAANLSAASWKTNIDVNLFAPVILCQEFVKQLPPHLGGVVVNLIDSRVLRPTPRHMSYTLSKSGLWTFTRTLAEELAPRVRVNAIGPGPTLPHSGQTYEQFKERCGSLPLRQPATLEEISRTTEFLISVQSLTGQMIALDGGDHLIKQYTPAQSASAAMSGLQNA